ncbi:hypothetical protein Acr_00g0077720 [Actinidia rufa]|uniref:Uncharacterized protein n=1 Tax=Actinidia rufa TaxID=165716 RepID=A0A7J0DUN7_9ERIC|nr:hypothetical protein Acr_00g0077720 [Actinidia rufa]
MLPKDVANLVEEGLKEIRDLMVMQQVQAWDANYAAATQAQNKAATTGAQRDKAFHDLAELQAVACSPVYEWVFNKGINQAGDNYDKQVAKLCLGIYTKGLDPVQLQRRGILESTHRGGWLGDSSERGCRAHEGSSRGGSWGSGS